MDREYLWAKQSKNDKVGLNASESLLRVYEVALVFRKPFKLSKQYNDHTRVWSIITGYHPLGAVVPHAHPCHKPLEALEPLIHEWSKPNDVVLDPFAGSGSILHAVSRAGDGRRGIGIEILDFWVMKANNNKKN